MTWGLALLAGGLILAAPALAQESPAPSAAPKPDKKICRMITPTGSIMAKRFCLTKSEWAQLGDINGASAEIALSGRKLIAPKEGGIPQ